MKSIVIIASLALSTLATAANKDFYKETVQCGSEGCSIVCHEPGTRWDSFLQSKGDLEITYFFNSGTRQIKADMGNGEFTILDTNPSYQTCRISGVTK
jgi:hypothetical protein